MSPIRNLSIIEGVKKKNSPKETYGAGLSTDDFDADDYELYGSAVAMGDSKVQSEGVAGTGVSRADEDGSKTIAPTRINPMGGSIDRAGPSTTFLAICRQSGSLEIYDLSKVDGSRGIISVPSIDGGSEGPVSGSSLVWRSSGCGLGTSVLTQNGSKAPRIPRMHRTRAAEIRFFFAGPSTSAWSSDSDTTASKAGEVPLGGALAPLRALCLLVETDLGDVHLYTASERGAAIDFARTPTGMVGRSSKIQANHTVKLQRRKIIAVPSSDPVNTYRHNRLHRFAAISAQSGLFAGTTRPFWVVSERGAPAVVQHRARHVAPAGGKDVPVASFCCDIALPDNGDDNDGFLTLHERIGQVGSQRITVFDG